MIVLASSVWAREWSLSADIRLTGMTGEMVRACRPILALGAKLRKEEVATRCRARRLGTHPETRPFQRTTAITPRVLSNPRLGELRMGPSRVSASTSCDTVWMSFSVTGATVDGGDGLDLAQSWLEGEEKQLHDTLQVWWAPYGPRLVSDKRTQYWYCLKLLWMKIYYMTWWAPYGPRNVISLTNLIVAVISHNMS